MPHNAYKVTQVKITALNMKVFYPPPYSPELAPSIIFSNPYNNFREKTVYCDKTKTNIKHFFVLKADKFYSQWINNLLNR